MERNTVQRRAIHLVLEQSGRPMGPVEMFEAAKAHAPGLGIATVYRTIKRLLDEGYLQQVDLPGEAPRYETAGRPHHPPLPLQPVRSGLRSRAVQRGLLRTVARGIPARQSRAVPVRQVRGLREGLSRTQEKTANRRRAA